MIAGKSKRKSFGGMSEKDESEGKEVENESKPLKEAQTLFFGYLKIDLSVE